MKKKQQIPSRFITFISPPLSPFWKQCKSNGNKSKTEVNESLLVHCKCSPVSPPLHPSFSAHPSSPNFLSPPSANSCTLPKTPSQLIRHCLLPSEPVHKGPPRSQRAFPPKLLHWWPPGMPVALGTTRTGQDGGWGLKPKPAVIWQEAEYRRDRLPIHLGRNAQSHPYLQSVSWFWTVGGLQRNHRNHNTAVTFVSLISACSHLTTTV